MNAGRLLGTNEHLAALPVLEFLPSGASKVICRMHARRITLNAIHA